MTNCVSASCCSRRSTARRYDGTATSIEEIAAREIERWPIGVPFGLRPRMQAITLDVILRAVFGIRGEQRLAQFPRVLPRLTEASGVVMWLPFLRRNLGPWSPWVRFQRVRRAVDDLVYDEIRLRRADPDAGARDDMLSLLLQARHEDGSAMSDQELRDELITLLTAGHETSATALAWAFERLLRTPQALERLLDDLDDDTYMDAVVKETLRVRPVVIDVARVAKADMRIGGWDVRAGTVVVPAIALVQMRPDLFPEPQAFRPERFLDAQPHAYTWIPFGGGCAPHRAAFAQYEIRTVLRTVLRGVRLKAPDPAPEAQRSRHVTLVPGGETTVVVERRGTPRPTGHGCNCPPGLETYPAVSNTPARPTSPWEGRIG